MTANRQDRVKAIELALIKEGKSADCDFLDSLLIVQDTDKELQGQPPCSDEVYELLQALTVFSQDDSGTVDRAFERLRQARMKAASTTHKANETAALRAENGTLGATQKRPSWEAIAAVLRNHFPTDFLDLYGQAADEIMKIFPEPREWVERKERRLIEDEGLGIYYMRRGKSDRRTAKPATTTPNTIESTGIQWEGCTVSTTREEELEAENFALAATQCHSGYGDQGGNFRCKYEDRIKELEAEVERLRNLNMSIEAEKQTLKVRAENVMAELAALKSRPTPAITAEWKEMAEKALAAIEMPHGLPADTEDWRLGFYYVKGVAVAAIRALPEQPAPAQITAEQLAEALKVNNLSFRLSHPSIALKVATSILVSLSIPSPSPQAQADIALGKNVRRVLEGHGDISVWETDVQGRWNARSASINGEERASTPDAAVEMLAGRVGG